MSVVESKGREGKDSGSGRDKRVQEATEEEEIKWRLKKRCWKSVALVSECFLSGWFNKPRLD